MQGKMANENEISEFETIKHNTAAKIPSSKLLSWQVTKILFSF